MRHALRLFCCIGILVAATGCALIANVARNRPVPALYTPPPEPLLVLVENFSNPALVAHEAALLARYVHAELARHDVAPLVSQDELTRLRQTDPQGYRQMNIAAIGRAVEARQILYVDLLEANMETPMAGQMSRGRLRVQVRVVDAQTGETRWPDGSEGHPLTIETPFSPAADDAALRKLREQMQREMSLRIARLFHPHRATAAQPQS